MKRPKPTHRVLFGDDISQVSQGWRCVSVLKIGSKWIYFKLFEEGYPTCKTKLAKWHMLLKHELDKKGRRKPL